MSNQGAVRETTICAVCDSPLSCTWTDTHGIGACITCGLPYRLLHYQDDQRVEKPPSITVLAGFVSLAREYWQAEHRRVFPGAHGLGIFRSRGGRTYSGATQEDIDAFDDWMSARKDRWPEQTELEPAGQSGTGGT